MRNPQPKTQGWTISPNEFDKVREVLGYLNFSSGNADPVFLQNLNVIWDLLPEGNRRSRLRDVLLESLGHLADGQSAFRDDAQARGVIQCALDRVVPAYRAFHSDLLFHLSDDDYEHPFFLGVVLEATLSQGGLWGAEEADRIVQGALQQLNDFVGYRPVAVLENGRKMEIYPHERFRPIPLFVAGAGVASGPYQELIEQTLTLLRESPADLLHDSHFHLEHMDELGCDVRAYDHLHPVYKRTNYLFGEWDPHRIDNKGYYRRFVVRQIILDSLLDWVENGDSRVPHEERLFDASAALCGTVLMASSISGSGPGTHDSSVSLTSLLPIVARRRDAFYTRMMQQVAGERAQRLQREEKKTQQPFGHVRQYLNMQLAGYGARQVQHRELAHLYALTGYADAGRRQAEEIPAASIRLETEIECTVATVHQELDRGNVERAVALIHTLPELLQRGVHCGAFVDPWNILGFQGQFPLFPSREDSIPDNRVETLLELMEAIFSAFSRTLGEAASRGLAAQREEVSARFQELANWWDRFGSDVIEDLPDISGQESWESATQVSHALTEWRQAGESAGDISFWRQQVEQFQTAHSYALVVDALLHAKDHVAAMGLLMQWLSQLNEVGFESPQHSIFGLLIRWMKLVTAQGEQALTHAQRSAEIRRLFAFLEANAEDWWSVPNLGRAVDRTQSMSTDDLEFGDMEDAGLDEIEDDERDDVFGAAYDGVVFRDSAEDGNWGDTADGEDIYRDTEFEAVNREMEPHLKFLNAAGQLWQMAAASFAATMHDRESGPRVADGDDAPPVLDEQTVDAIVNWHRQAQRWQIDLAELMEAVWDFEISEPTGDHDANVEYDIQLQVKFYLLHQVINTLICLRNAERLLNGIIPEGIRIPRGTDQDRQLTRVYRAVIQRDTATIRQLLPALLSRLSRNPLLYVPFENGGDPGQILRTQALQSVVRFLLRELPRLGLLRETWHLLYTAFRMERKWRPRGQAITEFDRLFTIALRSTLEALTNSALQWTPDEGTDTEDLVDAVGKVLDPYQWLWSEHSRTMRISAVDGLRKQEDWEELTEFIQRYGGDLFHASHLTLGNVRAILHNGVDWFLDYLEEEQDPLHPIRLLDDLDAGIIDRDTAEWCLEQVYSIIVDRFDRFLEYNTTTTQSDYGEMIYCLLEFLRLEARYDRDAWNLTPLLLVHEVLVRNGLLEAADMWESTFEMQTADIADQHLADLRRLQRKYGMRMPTITDHLKERFVKPLAVNRILSLVKPAVEDARANVKDSPVFQMLSDQVDDYLEDSWGSGIDLPEWLRSLEREVTESIHPNEGGRPGTEADLDVAPLPLTREEFQQQARRWRDELGTGPRQSSSRTRKKKPPKLPPEHDPDELD